MTRRNATRAAVATLGALASVAAIEHGIGEILQHPAQPTSPVIQSWPDTPSFTPLNGEPALTVLPTMLLTGILTILVAVALGIWALAFAHRRYGGPVLIAFALLLLLVGGGFGPPAVVAILGLAAMRATRLPRRPIGPVRHRLSQYWLVLLGTTIVAYLGLFPGTVLLHRFAAVDSPELVSFLVALAFAGLVLTLVATRAHDTARATGQWSPSVCPPTREVG